jgi:hypothetical protein
MSRRPFKLVAPPAASEHDIQAGIYRTLSLEIAPPGRVSKYGVCWWSVDQSFYGGNVPAARVGRGLVAGVPDILTLYAGRAFLIELKTSSGIVSDAQRGVLAACLAASCSVAVVTSAEELLRVLDRWAIPRAGRVRLG